MPIEFNSPLGRKQMAESAQQKRFTVGSPDDQHDIPSQFVQQPTQQELEERLKQARYEALHGSRLTADSKKRIELISGIGRLTKDVPIDGMTFSLRTLKSKETQEAAITGELQQYKVESAFETRRQFVARALYKIDGNDLFLIIGDDSIESRLNFVDELDESVITHLFNEFDGLRLEAAKKYSIKNEAELKEVAEEIKK